MVKLFSLGLMLIFMSKVMATAAAIILLMVSIMALGSKRGLCAEPDGKALYQTNCLTCHGEKGDGMGPAGQYLSPKPRNFKKDKFKNGNTVEAIAKTVAEGLPGTQMIGFKALSPKEREAVAAYVKTFGTK